MKEYLYRARPGAFDESGQIRIIFDSFEILSHTPKGKQVKLGIQFINGKIIPRKRWVSNSSSKRFAHPTKEEALISLRYRKVRHLEYLKWHTKVAETTIRLIDNNELKDDIGGGW